MELKLTGDKIRTFLKKNRYVILVLVVGLVFMLLPSGNSKEEAEQSVSTSQESVDIWDITEDLEAFLSQIHGVGKVKVMLTVSVGEETVYQENQDISTNETGSVIRRETVIISGVDRQELPLVSYIKAPIYLGAIIVCQGGDQAGVKLDVIDAVSKITGLSSDKISVLKMK